MWFFFARATCTHPPFSWEWIFGCFRSTAPPAPDRFFSYTTTMTARPHVLSLSASVWSHQSGRSLTLCVLSVRTKMKVREKERKKRESDTQRERMYLHSPRRTAMTVTGRCFDSRRQALSLPHCARKRKRFVCQQTLFSPQRYTTLQRKSD